MKTDSNHTVATQHCSSGRTNDTILMMYLLGTCTWNLFAKPYYHYSAICFILKPTGTSSKGQPRMFKDPAHPL